MKRGIVNVNSHQDWKPQILLARISFPKHILKGSILIMRRPVSVLWKVNMGGVIVPSKLVSTELSVVIWARRLVRRVSWCSRGCNGGD